VGVRFRNASSLLPRFHRTFQDDRHLDMSQAVKALRQTGYAGSMVPSRVVALAGNRGMSRAGAASCITPMRSLRRRANEEADRAGEGPAPGAAGPAGPGAG
jgi:hypothetical protein